MSPEILKFLYDIRLACEALFQFTDGKSLDEYQVDILLRSGIERQLTIIGEALSQALKIDPTLTDRIAGIRDINNFRNIIVHGYSTIENETVWGILQNDLPTLYDQVQALLSEETDQG